MRVFEGLRETGGTPETKRTRSTLGALNRPGRRAPLLALAAAPAMS